MFKNKIAVSLIVLLIIIVAYFMLSSDDNTGETHEFDIENKIITVTSVSGEDEYISYDSGQTWENDNEPSFYMNLEKGRYPVDVQEIRLTLFNNYSDHMVLYGHEYFLYEWKGGEFKQLDFPEDMAFPEEQLAVNLGDKEEIIVQIHRFELDRGKYRLEKHVRIEAVGLREDGEEYIIACEFFLD